MTHDDELDELEARAALERLDDDELALLAALVADEVLNRNRKGANDE